MKEKLLLLLNLKEQVKNKELKSKKNWLLTKKNSFQISESFQILVRQYKNRFHFYSIFNQAFFIALLKIQQSGEWERFIVHE